MFDEIPVESVDVVYFKSCNQVDVTVYADDSHPCILSIPVCDGMAAQDVASAIEQAVRFATGDTMHAQYQQYLDWKAKQ